MIEDHAFLLEVWREVGRHTEIGECCALLGPRLGEVLPVDLLIVRRIDLQQSCLHTVGAGAARGSPTLGYTRTEVGKHDMEKLLTWCGGGSVLTTDAPAAAELAPLLLPEGVAGSFLAGPLTGEEGPAGVFLLIAGAEVRLAPRHIALAQALIEPLSTALENDRRLREMTLLRQAAEADRQSLLTRLGRQDIAETIVGAEGGLRHVMERVEMVSRLDVPVLIFGETGSGKEVIARAIHTRSRRAGGPFLRVNCGAIPSELIDSELFGHERGSFTGAIAARKGWFERADGGTLFLDEIGELPPAAQVRLLRILQDGTFERVGGQRQLRVDVRIIAATHRDLQAMVTRGEFRQDLWYRIAVFPIDLPPLRDRREDIPALATHFALKACRRFGFAPCVPTPEDINLLCAYHWPGNVRELGAVLDRAAILGDGRGLDVPTALGLRPPAAAASRSQENENTLETGKTGRPPTGLTPSAPTPAASGPAGATAKNAEPAARGSPDPSFPTLDEAMRQHIEAALRRCAGRIEGPDGAARLLNINPHTLRSRMRKLGLDWRKFRTARPAAK